MNAGLTDSSQSSMLLPFSLGLQTTLLPVIMALAERSSAGDQTSAIATWYLPLFHDSDCLTHVAPKSGISAMNFAVEYCFSSWTRCAAAAFASPVATDGLPPDISIKSSASIIVFTDSMISIFA